MTHSATAVAYYANLGGRTQPNGASAGLFKGVLDMSRKPTVTGLALFLAGLTTLIAPLHGQNFYGSVVGTVSDASGASIAGGRVSITNGATGERRAVVTDAG